MPFFTPADHEASRMAAEIAREPRRNLARVRLAVLFATTEGAPLPEVVAKATSAMHRSAGCADLLIVLDHVTWRRRTENGKKALIEHALAGIRAVEDGGMLQLDSAGRPRLRKNQKDTPFGFRDVWAKYGKDSLEAHKLAESIAGDPTRGRAGGNG